LADDPDEAARRLRWWEALSGLAGGSWLDVVSLGANFGTPDTLRNRLIAREALDVWETQVRDLAVARAGVKDHAGDESTLWPALPLPGLLELWESVRAAADRVENNVNPRLAIEVFLADVRRARAA